MCGIAGYFGPERSFADESMVRMLTAISHRGPDDQGFLSRPTLQPSGRRVWLGNRRLAIQDLSPAGHQPMVDPANGSVIAFNGEVYNFNELRDEMIAQGHTFQSRCDTEVILQHWRREGLKGVRRWRGMFGVAIWDQAREELWLIRDHWGIKPLYYWHGRGGIAFCSEIRGILAADLFSTELSKRAIHDYLSYGAVQDPLTIINGVYSLPAGHAMRCSKDGIELVPCPQPDGVPDCDEIEALEPMLRKIVRQQMISDVPVASFLSGGVDSSIVSLLASEEASSDVNTIAVVFDEQQFSEAPYARRVAQRIGTTHHEAPLRGPEALSKAIEAIGCMDQPSVDGVNSYVVCGAARRLGFKVALSGMGGDEFFGGYSTFRRTGLIRRIAGAASLSPDAARMAGRLLGPLLRKEGRAGTKLQQYIENGSFLEHPYLVQRMHLYPQQIAQLSRAGVESDEANHRADERLRSLLMAASSMEGLNEISYLEASLYMGNMLLRDSDQMSMAHSLELRVPLVDQVLAAWLLKISARKKGFGRASKLWLRQAFGGKLPEEVFERRKQGFTLPFAVWLRGPLRPDVEETLRQNPAGLWDPSAAWGLWQEFLQGKTDWTRPWALYVLSRWVSKNITNIGSEAMVVEAAS